MKIINTTDYQTKFLRRMVSWCCREIGLPTSYVKQVTFKRSHRTYSGLASGRTCIVRIGPKRHFPTRQRRRGGVMVPSYTKRLDGLVGVTLHELQHLNQHYLRSIGRSSEVGRNIETDAQFAAFHGHNKFQTRRAELITNWRGQAALPSQRGTES